MSVGDAWGHSRAAEGPLGLEDAPRWDGSCVQVELSPLPAQPAVGPAEHPGVRGTGDILGLSLKGRVGRGLERLCLIQPGSPLPCHIAFPSRC